MFCGVCGGCSDCEGGYKCGVHVGVRQTEELRGLEWLKSNSKTNLCYPFWIPEMNLGDSPAGAGGCGQSEVGSQCVDCVEVCRVRRTVQLKGSEWLKSNSENKLCYPFRFPEMNLGNRSADRCVESEEGVHCGDYVEACGVRSTEELSLAISAISLGTIGISFCLLSCTMSSSGSRMTRWDSCLNLAISSLRGNQ